ncbi:MAG: hypothetical protein C7B46_10220 [Sulfobacillus benefaciens]|uniref:Major facilitator superfamily (MFS) profile domain-containing protein n=1 Tax=Sulfobacillus benefaciens TaxID=453960 RepID=A0A2T2XFR0_9FIRM|nr:MAG: hypothetical protein C7B46_10220 [Sulfobacillus benefaciens]
MATWGFLAVINPLFTVAFQARVVKFTSGIPMAVKFGGSLVLMGTSFLILIPMSTFWGVTFVLGLFALGEMLWQPTSEVFASSLASDINRGAYMGVFGASGSFAWAVGPLVDFDLRQAQGIATVWVFTALMGIGGAFFAMASLRMARGDRFRTDHPYGHSK